MQTQHTPGPWLFRTAPTSAGLCHIVSAADWRGAFIYGDGIRIGVDDALPKAQELAANARLIAAAPDLLEALEAILPFIPRTSASEGGASKYSENVKAADMVRAAIAKARGQQ